jgi:hydrogenase nickel incorporation protein HypB
MCDTCGCGKPDEFNIHDRNHSHDHENSHDHDHSQTHDHDHDHIHSHDNEHGHWHDHQHPHDHDHTHEHSHEHPHTRTIDLNIDIMSENNRLAELNRLFFEGRKVLCLNLVSSPGSGKTTLLEKSIEALKTGFKIFVIEGDQQTLLDASRIEKAGAPAVQINTGSGCHLDAHMVELALKKLDVDANSLLFIENVGNLVCPAMFDLGEHKRVVVISVTEGDDKPLKYPYIFQSSHLCIINKSDLLPYVDFDTEATIKHARSLNPDLEFIVLSAKTGEGMDLWYEWIGRQLKISLHVL